MHSSWLIDRLAESAHAVFPDDVPGWAYTDCLFFYHGTGLHATSEDDDQPFDAAFKVPALVIGTGAAIHLMRTEQFEEHCAWLDSIGQGALAASLREHARNLPPLLNQAVEAVATIRADAIYHANQRACEYLDVGHPARHRELIQWAVLLSGRTTTGGPIGGGRPRQVALAKALTSYPLRPGAKAPSEPTDADHAAGAIWMIVEEANNRIIRTRVEARKAIRQVCAALGVAFDVEVRELMRRNAPNGDTAMPQGSWYVVRDADSVAVCACPSQESAQSVGDAMGPGFTAKRATGGEWLRWDRDMAVADSRMMDVDFMFASSTLEAYTNHDVDEYQIQHYPEHADRVRAARYLSILMEATESESAGAPAQPERRSAFVASTDPRVTTCEAWKSLMHFREELRTNPRQDPGLDGWWSKWIGETQHWLYGGGDWGDGYYGDSFRRETPDCALRVRDVKAMSHARYAKPGEAFVATPGDELRTALFPAGTTYDYRGHVIDWAKPFPPIAERGPIIEWLESWIDRITLAEATASDPANTSARARASVPMDEPIPTPSALASRFRALGERVLRLLNSNIGDDAANVEIATIQELGGRLCCDGGKSGALDFGDLTPNTKNWDPPFDPKDPRQIQRMAEVYQDTWNNRLMIEAKRHPSELPGGETVGGGIYTLAAYDPEDDDGPMGVTHWPADRWRLYAEACIALCRLLAEKCQTRAGATDAAIPAPAAVIDPARIERLEVAAAAAFAASQTRESVPATAPGAGGVDAPSVRKKQPKRSRRERQMTWLAKAMLTVRDHPEWSDTAIADFVGIDKSRLSRSAEYQAAAKMARTPKIPKGSVSITDKNRSVDAEDDSFDPNRPASRQGEDEEDLDARIDREMRETQRETQRGARRSAGIRRSGGE